MLIHMRNSENEKCLTKDSKLGMKSTMIITREFVTGYCLNFKLQNGYLQQDLGIGEGNLLCFS